MPSDGWLNEGEWREDYHRCCARGASNPCQHVARTIRSSDYCLTIAHMMPRAPLLAMTRRSMATFSRREPDAMYARPPPSTTRPPKSQDGAPRDARKYVIDHHVSRGKTHHVPPSCVLVQSRAEKRGHDNSCINCLKQTGTPPPHGLYMTHRACVTLARPCGAPAGQG
eukprot:9490836-Pyramimonas_sp.AAC.2